LSGEQSALTLGRILYLGWYAPFALARRCAQEGPINIWRSNRGRRAMERAVADLPSTRQVPENAPAVFFLSGERFWYQTAFCAYSLRVHAGQPLQIIVVDDGTLTGSNAKELNRIIPGLRIIWTADLVKRLDTHLPVDRFPTLRGRRLTYPHLRKLTDVHAGSTGWKLVLDSDMLFYRRPDFVMDWMLNPDRPCHMVDVEDAYGYSNNLMEELSGAPIPSRLNVGMIGLRSEAINWDHLEIWCRTMLAREGSHYLQEQALTAMMMGNQECKIAPKEDYVVMPSRTETERPQAVLHHYVGVSKAWYYRFGWRSLLMKN
jgi:hypothetical protein